MERLSVEYSTQIIIESSGEIAEGKTAEQFLNLQLTCNFVSKRKIVLAEIGP